MSVQPIQPKPKAQSIKVGNATLLNGQVAELISVGGRDKLYEPAANSFLKMMEAAKQAGLDYNLESTYRLCGAPGDGEKYLRNEIEFTQWAAWELWQAKQNNPNDPRYQKFNLAANPSINGCNSKHGYGLAIDIYGKPKESIKNPTFYKGVKEKNPDGSIAKTPDGKVIYKIQPQQDALQTWIRNNGGYYGWKWTGAKFPTIETWHFDYDYNSDQSKESSSPLLVNKSSKQLNDITLQDQRKNNVNKSVTRDIAGFYS